MTAPKHGQSRERAQHGHDRPVRAGRVQANAQAMRHFIADTPAFSLDWLSRAVETEIAHRTGFLWLPVAFGLGILAYFSASQEPSLWAGPVAMLMFMGFVRISSGFMRAMCLAMLFVAAGFSASAVRTQMVSSPMLERQGIFEIKGFVETIDPSATRHRLLLRPTGIDGVKPEALPFRVRIGAPGAPTVLPGAFISVQAKLAPPSEAAMPGGYDFRRNAFFQSTGGVGYTLGKIKTEAAPSAPPWDLRFNAAIDYWRNALTTRISQVIGGEAGALAAALITGKRGLIAETTNDNLRASGLYHIVSISGLHMVLAAGIMFWSLRAVLAAIPVVALSHPIKKYAAAGGMVGATLYCIFSGSEVATERSLIMVLVMLGAILFDRPALAMRNLAISALLVLAREPESLLGPSFQMSFAAVAGLIAANQIWRDWTKSRARTERGVAARGLARLALTFGAIVATTVVASIATAPFSAFHFHRLNPLGLIGNSMAIPLVELVVMPAAVIGTILVPFGLDWVVWIMMGEGVRGVLFVAEKVAALDNAVVTAPRAPGYVFALMVLALLVLVGFRTGLRWFCLPVLLVWFALLRAAPLPDLMVDPAGKMALVRGEGGIYRLLSIDTPSNFTLSQWLPSLGDSRSARDSTLKAGVRCDKTGCAIRMHDGRMVALSARSEALRDDCQRADIVITPHSATNACLLTRRVIDRRHLERYGSTRVITRNAQDWSIDTTLNPDHKRPWRHAYNTNTMSAPIVASVTRAGTNQNTTSLQDDPGLQEDPRHQEDFSVKAPWSLPQ